MSLHCCGQLITYGTSSVYLIILSQIVRRVLLMGLLLLISRLLLFLLFIQMGLCLSLQLQLLFIGVKCIIISSVSPMEKPTVKKPKKMTGIKKEVANINAFDAFYHHQDQPEYPYYLANCVSKTKSQFEKSRAFMLLGEWARDYQSMSEIKKYKFGPYIQKILKILFNEFMQKQNMDFCLGNFYYIFYHIWKSLNQTIIEQLCNSNSYVLSFVWYISFNFVQKLESQRQYDFCNFLADLVQQPLRKYESKQDVQSKKLLQTLYLINIHGLKEPFAQHAFEWTSRMQMLINNIKPQSEFGEEERAKKEDAVVQLLIDVTKCKHLFTYKRAVGPGQVKSQEEAARQRLSNDYWMESVLKFINIIEDRIEKMVISKKLDHKILDNFIWLMNEKEIQQHLEKHKNKYLHTIIIKIKPNSKENPNNIFNIDKYGNIRLKLYSIFYQKNQNQTYMQVNMILKEFSKRSYFCITEENYYNFLYSVSERPIRIEESTITDILKILLNQHQRRNLNGKIFFILAKVIHACAQGMKFAQQTIGNIIKAFYECINNKNIQNIDELKYEICRLYYLLLQKDYNWDENKRIDLIFTFCQEFERNAKTSQVIIIRILIYLIRKNPILMLNSNMQRLQSMISDLSYKIMYDRAIETLKVFVSLMVEIYKINKWENSVKQITAVCSSQTMNEAINFRFQAQTLMKKNDMVSEFEQQVILSMVQNREKWSEQCINLYLAHLEIFFLKINSSDSYRLLKIMDHNLLMLFKKLYEESAYGFHLITFIAAKIYPSIPNYQNLLQLESYCYVKEKAFDMLARSFCKTSIQYMNYLFSRILLKTDDMVGLYKKLNKDMFLDYLFQGLNDFISKQQKYYSQFVQIMLLFKVIYTEPQLYYPGCKLNEFTDISKNVAWWIEDGSPINFKYLIEEKTESLLMPEYRQYYQATIKNQIKNYQNVLKERKLKKLKQIQEKQQSYFDQSQTNIQ